MWTGFDYRGEPSPYQWPNISSQYGIIDMCGFPKDSFFYYQSWWTSKQVLHLFPHWNWPGMEGKEIAVWAFSNLDKVELLLTDAVRAHLDPTFTLRALPATAVKGIAEPVVTYTCPSLVAAGDDQTPAPTRLGGAVQWVARCAPVCWS